jgi:peroxiredoxin
MKTLKILTAICVITFSCAILLDVMNYSKSSTTYAGNSNGVEKTFDQNRNEISDPGNLMGEQRNKADLKGYNIGDIATDFKLKNVDGTMVSLSDYPESKGYIVIFTCSHCPYSKAYEDRIIALDKQFKNKGYPVIAINPNNPETYPEDSFEFMVKRANEKGFTFPYLFDAKQTVYPQYGATKTPHVYLLNKENGKNRVKYIGAIDDNYQDKNAVKNHFLQNAVNALLHNKDINPKTTAAIGCSIKR